MIRTTALTFFLAVAPVAAFAYSCPALMAEIDTALPDATITEAERERVEMLRAKGSDLHDAGDHTGSEAALNEALEILGS